METGDVLDPTDRLRDVFDLCDVDRKGFITVDHFIELAKSHFTTDDDASQQVSSLRSMLLIMPQVLLAIAIVIGLYCAGLLLLLFLLMLLLLLPWNGFLWEAMILRV